MNILIMDKAYRRKKQLLATLPPQTLANFSIFLFFLNSLIICGLDRNIQNTSYANEFSNFNGGSIDIEHLPSDKVSHTPEPDISVSSLQIYAKPSKSNNPLFCKHAGCSRGLAAPFFNPQKGLCFGLTSCSGCPVLSRGRSDLCTIGGVRKGFALLGRAQLIPGPPKQTFEYQKASAESNARSIKNHTRETSSKTGESIGHDQEYKEDSWDSDKLDEINDDDYGNESDADVSFSFLQVDLNSRRKDLKRERVSLQTQNDLVAAEDKASEAGVRTDGNRGDEELLRMSRVLHGKSVSAVALETHEIDKNSERQKSPDLSQRKMKNNVAYVQKDSSLNPSSFVRVEAANMVGIDTYDDFNDSESTVGAGSDEIYSNSLKKSVDGEYAGGNFKKHPMSKNMESRFFSLSSENGMLSTESCHIDHKGYIRVLVSVTLQHRNPDSTPLIMNNAVWGNNGNGGERSTVSMDEDDSSDSFSFSSGFIEQGKPTEVLESTNKNAAVDLRGNFIDTLFSPVEVNMGLGFSEESDESDIEESGKGNKFGFIKKLFRRKSKEGEDDVDEEETDFDDDTDSKRKGARSRIKKPFSKNKMHKLLTKGKHIGLAATKASPSHVDAEIAVGFNSPAASKCTYPSVWKGRMSYSSLIKLEFSLRVLATEVTGKLSQFISSALSLQFTCRQRSGCMPESTLLSCVQVTCGKTRRIKQEYAARFSAHQDEIEKQVKRVGQLLQEGKSNLKGIDRAAVAKAYAEKIRQQEEQQKENEMIMQKNAEQQIQNQKETMLNRQNQMLVHTLKTQGEFGTKPVIHQHPEVGLGHATKNPIENNLESKESISETASTGSEGVKKKFTKLIITGGIEVSCWPSAIIVAGIIVILNVLVNFL